MLTTSMFYAFHAFSEDFRYFFQYFLTFSCFFFELFCIRMLLYHTPQWTVVHVVTLHSSCKCTKCGSSLLCVWLFWYIRYFADCFYRNDCTIKMVFLPFTTQHFPHSCCSFFNIFSILVCHCHGKFWYISPNFWILKTCLKSIKTNCFNLFRSVSIMAEIGWHRKSDTIINLIINDHLKNDMHLLFFYLCDWFFFVVVLCLIWFQKKKIVFSFHLKKKRLFLWWVNGASLSNR